MERIREEIVSNVDKLQLEVHEITTRLNSLLQQNQKIVNNLKQLNYKELLSNKDYYLAVTNQQHGMVQVLLSINLQLEELQNSNKLTLKNCVDDNPCKVTEKKHEEIKERKSIKVKELTKSVDHVVANGNNSATVSDLSSLSTSEEVNSTNSSDGVICTRNTNKHYEDTINATVLAKLKHYGLLSTKQRYINNLPKPAMPDLSFKITTKNETVLNGQIPKETKKGNRSIKSPKTRNVNGAIKRKLTIEVDPQNEYFEGNIPPPLDPHLKSLCLISYVKTPTEFYINILDETIEAIERIPVDYSEHHDSPEIMFLTKDDAKQKLNSYCLCYVDAWEFWYRAKIIDWQDGEMTMEDVTVYLVDYGYTLNLTYKNLRPLLKKYALIRQCAIKCHMAYLFPPGYSIDNKTNIWPEESISAFKNIVGFENSQSYQVVYVENINDSWAIDLVKPTDTEDDPTIGQLFIDAKVCVEIIPSFTETTSNSDFIKTQLKTACGFHGISPDMTDNEKLDTFCMNIETKEPGNLDEALTNYKAKDEARTCQVFRRYGTCYKLPNCNFDHQHLRRDGYTTDKVEAYIETTLPISLPRVGQTVDVRITSISSLTLWYGHMISNISTYAQLVESLSNTQKIQNYKKLSILPSLGELVIVKNESSTQWYRGQVKEVYQNHMSPEEVVQVFLVDTGDIIESKLSELRMIPHELLYVPFQAILLKLHGIIEKGDNLPHFPAIMYCETNYVGIIFKANIVHTSSSTLVVTLTRRDEDIRKKIVKDGYGEIVETDTYPKTLNKLTLD